MCTATSVSASSRVTLTVTPWPCTYQPQDINLASARSPQGNTFYERKWLSLGFCLLPSTKWK